MVRHLQLLRIAFAVAVIILSAFQVAAQSTARVEGIVTDDSGGALPGTTVTATHVATNVARSVVTDSSGSYTLTPLLVGEYRVRFDLNGFKPATVPVRLKVNEVARIDMKLELGAIAEELTVMAAAPVIEKTTSYIGTVIEEEMVANLPLNGRNFTQLATLSPGVTRGIPGSNASGGGSGTDSETFRYSEFGGIALSVNGLREQFNNYLIEGIDNNESLVNSIAYVPSPEAIREFNVITTSAPAEFGRAGGAVQNLVIKSGTNELNGSVFYFVRPKSLAAKPALLGPNDEKPDFKNEDFGATAGGPIIRDRAFFFFSYHGLRNSIPVEAGNYVTVPTQKMRNGDFSELLDPATSGLSAPVIVYDPATGVPFPNNKIPEGLINPVAKRYLSVYPLPTRPGAVRNYLTHRQKESTYDDIDAKIDFAISAADQLFVSGSQWSDSFSDPGRIPGYQAGFGAGTSENEGYTLRGAETHVFGNSLVNEARVGFTDFHFAFLPVGFGADQNKEIGIPGPGGVTVGNGISLIGGGDGTYIEYLGDFGQYQIDQRTLQISDAVTWMNNNHTFKFGASTLRREMGQNRTRFGKGFYFFRDSFGWQEGFTGYEVADMLIGTTIFTATGVPGFVPRTVKSSENALYVQDDWRIRPNLTLNLGLRYDLLTPYYEEDNRMANYDPVTKQLRIAGQNGVSRETIDADRNNIGPRIGFNYLFDERTSIRGGYGIFYSLDRGGIDNQLTENPPAVVTDFRFGFGGCIPGACVKISDPIPLPRTVDPANPVLPDGSGVVFIPEDSENTEVQQWNLGVQRELNPKTSAALSYVGTRGSNLATVVTSAGFGGGIADRVTTIMYIGESQYDSLQASVRGRHTRGLSYLLSYTLGEATDIGPGFFAGNPSRGGSISDPTCAKDPTKTCDLSKDEGPSDFDSRHRLTFAGTWAVPFMQGNTWLGGWMINGVFTYQSGTPYSAYNNSGVRVGSRNSLRLPATKSADLSVFKSFTLPSATALELRVEAFNIFDSAQYSRADNNPDSTQFRKLNQTRLNSERQVQLAVRFLF